MGTQVAVTLTEDERRKRYAAAIQLLGDHFPADCEPQYKQAYFERLMRSKRHPDDVDLAVDRVIGTRKAKSFPPWAEIKERLIDIANEAMGYQHRDKSGEPMAPHGLSPEALEAELAKIRAYREEIMPKKKPCIKTDREARRKHLGIKVLTRKESDDLDRERRQRERDRHAKTAETDSPKRSSTI